MKNLIIIILFLSSCQMAEVKDNQSNTKNQPNITVEEEEIAKNLIQGVFDDIWAGVDSTKIDSYHTADFILFEHGEIWKNEEIKAYINRKLSEEDRATRTNKMDYISIDKYGESIQIAYWNFAEFTKADTLVGEGQWLESALAVKTKDGWRLKMMHSTWAGKRPQ